jgi:hypothetical protein
LLFEAAVLEPVEVLLVLAEVAVAALERIPVADVVA